MANGIEAARIFVQYLLPAVIGCGSFTICVLLMRRMKQLHRRVAREEEELRTATATWTKGLASLGKEMETIEAVAKHSCSVGRDANAATRRKVLKMYRLGHSVEQIARELRLSKGEVMLLLKVHTIILRS